MKKEFICILCPQSCLLTVDIDNDYKVTGNRCEKGIAFGKQEMLHPIRELASTVKIEGGNHRRLPVKTDKPIPKEHMAEAMKALCHVSVKSPVKMGDVILSNVCGTDIHFIATRDM